MGADPRKCTIPDGRPGRCIKKDRCSPELDYFGLSDDLYCTEKGTKCCPLKGINNRRIIITNFLV